MQKGLFIAVEGAIGIGKTTMATILGEHFGYTVLREIVEENPFLADFYKNDKENALQTEAFFLFNRIKQLKDIDKNYINEGKSVISDYHSIKNLIFAGITLNADDLHKYKQMYNIFIDDLPQPDIIVYLKSDIDVIMKKIKLRDRNFERTMDVEYINTLTAQYDYYLNDENMKRNFTKKEPIIVTIDNSNLDIIYNDGDKKFVVNKVEEAIKSLGGANV